MSDRDRTDPALTAKIADSSTFARRVRLAEHSCRFAHTDETTMSIFPEVDELLRTVAELQRLGKACMKATQGIKGPCECSCHTDASIVHIGPLCCEKALAD
jgi:hypothetical protein